MTYTTKLLEQNVGDMLQRIGIGKDYMEKTLTGSDNKSKRKQLTKRQPQNGRRYFQIVLLIKD